MAKSLFYTVGALFLLQIALLTKGASVSVKINTAAADVTDDDLLFFLFNNEIQYVQAPAIQQQITDILTLAIGYQSVITDIEVASTATFINPRTNVTVYFLDQSNGSAVEADVVYPIVEANAADLVTTFYNMYLNLDSVELAGGN